MCRTHHVGLRNEALPIDCGVCKARLTKASITPSHVMALFFLLILASMPQLRFRVMAPSDFFIFPDSRAVVWCRVMAHSDLFYFQDSWHRNANEKICDGTGFWNGRHFGQPCPSPSSQDAPAFCWSIPSSTSTLLSSPFSPRDSAPRVLRSWASAHMVQQEG